MGVATIRKIRAVASSRSPDATRSSTVGPDRNLGLSERRASGQKRPSSYWRVTSAAMSGARMVLNDREKDILVQRRLTDEPVTLEDLSSRYNVSRERIRQIEVRAFEKLQDRMRALARERGMAIEA